ncbi:MAG TPA: response regulator transcription factor [Aquabacterium sp.]|uniref:response regulator transcription factor n=1 Tax=Aquabacterium sp. TaxID=1872578 RepID=UPI002E30DD72|nr:response regulator transcription factor [Aquabacterium sp.]HEX5373439.1 response regulator transcription factor [Aquabacterium sp.]
MHLLLLEDDVDLGQAVAEHLEACGHTVSWMKLCAQADQALTRMDIDMVLLDLRLPDGDALQLLKSWRSRGDKHAVIVLTARDQISDRVHGLQAGADDYLVKPFDLDELVARVDAVSRRMGIPQTPIMQTGAVALDFEHKIARLNDQVVDLTAMEWALLSCLAAHPGHTLNRQQLKTAMFQPGRSEAESNSMEVIISRLRRKLGANLISTHRGLGYRLDL